MPSQAPFPSAWLTIVIGPVPSLEKTVRHSLTSPTSPNRMLLAIEFCLFSDQARIRQHDVSVRRLAGNSVLSDAVQPPILTVLPDGASLLRNGAFASQTCGGDECVFVLPFSVISPCTSLSQSERHARTSNRQQDVHWRICANCQSRQLDAPSSFRSKGPGLHKLPQSLNTRPRINHRAFSD